METFRISPKWELRQAGEIFLPLILILCIRNDFVATLYWNKNKYSGFPQNKNAFPADPDLFQDLSRLEHLWLREEGEGLHALWLGSRGFTPWMWQNYWEKFDLLVERP